MKKEIVEDERKCCTLVGWEEVGDMKLIGPQLVQITSKK
jgi:hypothetical protein